MRLLITIILALFTVAPLSDAAACGDTTYRVGKDASYRVYTAPLPANVLVYGQSEGARAMAATLARSGHSVKFVNEQRQLTSELSTSKYDVVIAPFSDHRTIEESSSASGSDKTTYLPVADNRAEAEVASESYSKVLVADKHDIKSYLKAIHKTLKENS